MRTLGAAIGLGACLAAAAAVSLAADDAVRRQPAGSATGTAPESGTSLPALLAPPLTEHEEKLRTEIQSRIAGDSQSAVARKAWRYISPTDAVMLGLQKNLAIRLAGRQPLLAREALLEARAVFNPVLQVAVSQAITSQSGRSITADITRSTFGQGACQSIPLPPGAATNNKPDVIQICFARPGGSQQLTDTVFATPTSDAHPGANSVSTFSVGVTQQLPWGPVLKLVETSSYNKTYYSAAGQSFSYGAPWSSSLFAELTLPLPGTKGFGPFSPNDFAIKLAQKGTERAFWDVKTAINSILLQIDLAFWDLVASAENLAATMENRKLVESLSPGYERMYKQEVISRSDKSQIDAELARVGVEEELALSSYYSAATALATLVEDDPAKIADHILFPAGFSADSREPRRPRLDEIQQTSLKHRPELMARQVDSGVSNLAVKFAENQARADISADVSTTLSQDATVYGYRNLSDSLHDLGSPDRRNLSGALTYVNPLGRRAAISGLKTANANLTASEYATRITVNDVIRDVNDAYSAYSSSITRVEDAQDALKLSEFAYQQVEKRFQIGEFVSQVELNRNRRDVLSARLSLIAARIDVRRAQSRLLAAQGVIADRYPGMHAYNDFERYRIAMLGSNKALKYFRTDSNAQTAEQR